MLFREYDSTKDKQAIERIWKEIGWLEDHTETLGMRLEAVETLVAEIRGEAECAVMSAPGKLRYLNEDIPFAGVVGVTTSRIARKQGAASRLTALLLAHAAANGAVVTGLGAFEQGFYNRLGMGSGTYEHYLSFDPTQLKVPDGERIPYRLSGENWKQVYAASVDRHRVHGNITIEAPGFVQAEAHEHGEKGFGLGFRDGPDDKLSHFLWFHTEHMSNGPYRVTCYAYQTQAQFMELLSVIKSLGDQVHCVRMQEPGDMILQELLRQPFRHSAISRRTEKETGVYAHGWWQMRIMDLPACLEHTHLRGPEVRFNLVLEDPIEQYLDDDAPWQGISGEYVVTLGQNSRADLGNEGGLPTVTASVNAFTRLWLGVRPATGLAFTDRLECPQELLKALDDTLRLPRPSIGWPL